MHKTIDVHQFRDAFRAMGRDDQFSYDGLGHLFDYLEDMDGADQPGMELDVIGLCCDYVEMTLAEVCEQYDLGAFDNEDEQRDAVVDFLNYNTALVAVWGDHVLFAQF